MKSLLVAAALLLSAASFNAAAYDRYEGNTYDRYSRTQVRSGERVREGVVVMVRSVEVENENEMNAGALVGALAGGALGRQVGGGTGRDLATGLGVVLGAVAGGKVQRGMTREVGTEIYVNFGHGDTVAILQRGRPQVREGDDVLVTGYGQNMRVIAVSANYQARRN